MMTLTVLAALLAAGWTVKTIFKALAGAMAAVAEPADAKEAAR